MESAVHSAVYCFWEVSSKTYNISYFLIRSILMKIDMFKVFQRFNTSISIKLGHSQAKFFFFFKVGKFEAAESERC